jgi:hypothetical protein
MKLTLSEERRLTADPRRRTSPPTLRKLAAGHMLYEPTKTHQQAHRSEWDRFEVRRVGLAVQRRMAKEFQSDPQKIRIQSVEFTKNALDLETGRWPASALNVLDNLGLVLAMVPGVEDWSADEKRLAASIIEAKAGRDEALYLRRMQKHARLRLAIIRLAS